MQVDGHDKADRFECPMLAGLTDEQRRQKIRSDPMVARCLAARRKAEARSTSAAPAHCELRIDNIQGADASVD